MRTTAAGFKSAALISSVMVLPLLVLELFNQPFQKANITSSIVLFSVLWLVPVAFIVLVRPVVRADSGVTFLSVNTLVRLAFAILLVFFWGSLVADQMPCFLGVPNCD